jgi:YidC/Oxa1 family membrane protein insertase
MALPHRPAVADKDALLDKPAVAQDKRATMAAGKRKFDWVQIGGVALALLLFVAGTQHLQSKRAAEVRQWEQQREAWEKQQAQKTAKAEPQTPTPGAGTTNGAAPKKGEPAPPQGQQPPATAENEPEKIPDVVVEAGRLTLVFTAEGAALKRASLAQEYADAGAKDRAEQRKGLEILTEIEPGKAAFAIPVFEIGSPDPDRKKDRLICSANGFKPLSARVWKLESDTAQFDADGKRQLRYSTTLAGKYTVTKTFTVYKDRYYVAADIAVANRSDAPVTFSYEMYGPPGILLDGPPQDPTGGAYVYIVAELAGREHGPGGGAVIEPEIKQVSPATAAKEQSESTWVSKPQNLWGAVKNRFYTAMLLSLEPAQLIRISAIPIAHRLQDTDKRFTEPNIGILGVRIESPKLEPGATSPDDAYAMYLGPSTDRQFAEAEKQLELTPPYRTEWSIRFFDMGGYEWPRVDWLARQMVTVFRWLHGAFANYGMAVILLTLLIKAVLHPLQRKMMVSMSKLQTIQPELQKLQAKYKGQTSAQARQKMWQEQQDLMKKSGASYSSGCLPMFVQLPILTALYGVFSRAFEMRGAEFLWMRDLSQADRLATFGVWPGELNLLPLIYAVLQLMQMKITPQAKATSPEQEMQQKMMQYMPVVLSVMFYRLPSGLMLYFAVSAIFGIAESWYIRKFLIGPPPGSPDAMPPKPLARPLHAKG